MKPNLRLAAVACVTAVLAAASLGAGSAMAAGGGNAVLTDCQANGRLTHSYTLKELRHALAIMPASIKQYTNCSDVIFQGIASVTRGKPTGSQGGGGSFLPTPVIIILVVLILVGVTFGALAIRRRRAGPAGDGPPGGAAPSASASPPGGAPPES
jgi:hypothetical protein